MIPFATLSLMALLGMRHGLDPDHVAVIDNITFRAMDERPAVAAWTGFLFSIGHSFSVLLIALIFGLLGRMVVLPPWFEQAMRYVVIALLVWIGTINVRALLAAETYSPQGWRKGLIFRMFKDSTHPIATLAVGAIFGLVVDTAVQIATWGTLAAAAGGTIQAVWIGAAFAAGMVLTDSVDSMIVARLMRGTKTDAARYRRLIGWLIVALCYGMALQAIARQLLGGLDLSDPQSLLIGSAMAVIVIVSLVVLSRRSKA